MEIAIEDLVQAKWTDQIHQEWTGNLINNRPEVKHAVQITREKMDTAVPDALVKDYESLISSISLPDPKDRHVLAAAVKCGAQIIVTTNLKDFPNDYLSGFDVEALHPDKFIEHHFSLNPGAVIACVKRIRARLQNPEMNAESYLVNLATLNLPVTVRLLQDNMTLI